MARDATARLYDVHKNSLVFKRRFDLEKYDVGEIIFRAKRGRLVDLGKLRESIWATRLSGGTKSGVLSLEVTVAGEVIVEGKHVRMHPSSSSRQFILAAAPDAEAKAGGKTKFDEMRAAIAGGKKVTKVSGKVDGWRGRWPDFLRKPVVDSPRILVTSFETSK